MSTPKSKTLTVRLGKKLVPLKFTFPAFDRMHREYGVNAMRPSTFINFDPSTGVTLVWGGQLHSEKLSREAVAKLMPTDTRGYLAMMEVVATALNVALGAKPDEEKA